MTIGLFPPPTPYENNPAWQEINKQLNVDFKMNIVAPGDYVAKLATVMAGNDFPDLLFFYYNLQTAITAVAGVPQFLEAQGADLTPYLAGDAIKDYPSLANIPTRAWKNSGSVFNGRVIMIPKPLYAEGFVFLKNVNHWDADVGKDYVPKNADDFKRDAGAHQAAGGSVCDGGGRCVVERRCVRRQVVFPVLRCTERVAPRIGWQADAHIRDA
jgi:putative aldouronate transport system substrate-binding protein